MLADLIGLHLIEFFSKEEKKQKVNNHGLVDRLRLRAEIERAKSLAKAEAEYDNYAQIAMKTSWKDEYLVLVISGPFIISFATPFIALLFDVDLTPQLAMAWQLVAAAPTWYQYIFTGIVIATFGLRWMAKGNLDKMIPKKKKGIVKVSGATNG